MTSRSEGPYTLAEVQAQYDAEAAREAEERAELGTLASIVKPEKVDPEDERRRIVKELKEEAKRTVPGAEPAKTIELKPDSYKRQDRKGSGKN